MPKYRVNFVAHLACSGSLVVNADSVEKAAQSDFQHEVDGDMHDSWFQHYESCGDIEVTAVTELAEDDDANVDIGGDDNED